MFNYKKSYISRVWRSQIVSISKMKFLAVVAVIVLSIFAARADPILRNAGGEGGGAE